MAVTELKVLDCEFTEAVLAMFTPASCPQYGKAHLVDVRLSGNYMEVVRLRVKAAMLSFQHSRHRRRQIPVHSPGKSCLYGLQICRYQNADTSFGQ